MEADAGRQPNAPVNFGSRAETTLDPKVQDFAKRLRAQGLVLRIPSSTEALMNSLS